MTVWTRNTAGIRATWLLLAMLLTSAAPGQVSPPEPTGLLRWKNGDVLPGRLVRGAPGEIRWASPMFLDDLVVYPSALESMQLGGKPEPVTGTFRVTTLSGDVWTGDLVDSDAENLVFSSPRLGQVRVKRRAIGSLDRVATSDNAGEATAGEGFRDAERTDPEASRGDLTPPAGMPLTRIALQDGRTFLGWLFVGEGGAWVLEEDGSRQVIRLAEIKRVVQPGTQARVDPALAELTYADGTLVHGTLESAGPDHLSLQTDFAETPVACVSEPGCILRFGPPEPRSTLAGRSSDELIHAAGRLHGRLSFVFRESGLSWVPEGALAPVRLGPIGGVRIILRRRSLTTRSFFDEAEFPYALHLMGGDVLPCRLDSYDGAVLRFASPYVAGKEIAASHLKAIEFEPSLGQARDRKPATPPDEWFEAIFGPREKIPQPVEPADLERALTVPRFYRDQPPSHVLLARNGDVMRGTLVAIHGDTVEFESRRRRATVPLRLLTRVVTIRTTEDEGGNVEGNGNVPPALVRVTLNDGSVLSFEAIESKHGVLRGHSPVYGETTIPVENIAELDLGPTAAEDTGSAFQSWVAQPAREPEFSRPAKPAVSETILPAEPTAPPPDSEEPDPPTATPSVEPQPASDAEQSGQEDAAGRQQDLALGNVVVNAADRSLRLPITINQRSGPVEYALVTDTGKTHESVFRTDVAPPHIHVALLLLGGVPSDATRLAADPLEAVPGEPVVISVVWQEQNSEVMHPLEDFITETGGGGTLTPEPWIFNGSIMQASGLAAQASGSIVSLQLDPEALINNPRPGRFNDELHRANSTAMPADDRQLEMIIRLVRQPADSADARE
jgi:hypothetical protein